MDNKEKKESLLKTIYGIIGVAVLILAWAIFSAVKVNQGYNINLFPNPKMVFTRFFLNFADKDVWTAVGWTFLRLGIGFGISFVLAAIIGTLAGLFKRVRYAMKPITTVMKSIPTAAITFVILILLKENWTPCALVFLVAFPIIYESFVKGITNVDKAIVEAAKTDASTHSAQVIFRILIPSALPYVSLSVVTSLGLALKVSVMSEIVAGGSEKVKGLGRLIYVSNSITFDIVNVYALSVLSILIIVVIAIVLNILRKNLLPKINK